MWRALVLALCAVACGSVETPSPPASAANATSVCPLAGAATVPGSIAARDVSEASGIVASAVNDGVYWVHNDSGDSARAFALSATGQLLATLSFDTAPANDIEDMAIEDGPDGSFLYFGDIGDNAVVRDSVTIHRVPEPRLPATEPVTLTATSEKMTVKYADAPHNAETLLFDPVTRDLLIVTKVTFGKSQVHRVGPFAAGTTATTTKIASITAGVATGGDISRDGKLIAVRSYGTSAAVWTRAAGEELGAALGRTSCSVPVASEGQGEAFAFLPDASGYVTVSEGEDQPLHRTALE